MVFVQDITWKKNMTITQLVTSLGNVGFQGTELDRCALAIAKMKKEGAKIYLTFTSNMVTSGLRGLFAQMVALDMAHILVTTVGSIEEDIMRAHGEQFMVGQFHADDVKLHEQGLNRVGNLMVKNESYARFEELMLPLLEQCYKKKARWPVSELLHEIGLTLHDEHSILYQCAKQNVPLFCPAITDGAFGFHLFMFSQKHKDFIVDVVEDFKNILFSTSHDDKKGLIALGGSVSKHHAILATLLNGGLDYAVYMTTARPASGSMSGATTQEAKSWGKIKDDADAAMVVGDVTINFPLALFKSLDLLSSEGILHG